MKKNMPYPPEEQYRAKPRTGYVPDQRDQRYTDPRVRPENYANRRDPRPERRIYPEQDHPSFAPAPHAGRKRSVLLLLLLGLLLIGLVAGGYFLLKNRTINFKANDTSQVIALRESTNRYRVASTKAQDATLKMYRGLSGFFDLFIGTDQINFHKQAPENKFISNDEDYLDQELNWAEFNEKLLYRGTISGYLPEPPPQMGRLVIPKIGVDGRMCVSNDYTELDYATKIGFGILNYSNEPDLLSDLDEEGQTNILGHRVLSRTHGLYYLNEMEVGDSFYIDDYRSGKRYYYHVGKTEHLVGEELDTRYATSPPDGYEDYNNNLPANTMPISPLDFELYRRTYNIEDVDGKATFMEPPLEGNSVMLIVCDPLIFYSSENRILVWGKVVESEDIPADDPHYARYRGENPDAVVESEEAAAEEEG